MFREEEHNKSLIRAIFDFILTANKSTAQPKNATKVQNKTKDGMVQALAEIASAPSVYANDQSLEVIKDSLNDLAGKDSKTKKAANQVNFMRGANDSLNLGLGAVVARASGVSETESLQIGRILGSEMIPQDERNSLAKSIATKTSVLEVLANKGLNYGVANQLSQTFNSLMESSQNEFAGKDLTNLSKAERVRLEAKMNKKLSGFGISPEKINFNELFDKYLEKSQKYSKGRGYDWDLGKLNRGITDIVNNPAVKLQELKLEEIKAELTYLTNLPDTNPEKQKRIKLLKQIEIWQRANSNKHRWSRFFGEASLNLQRLGLPQDFTQAEINFKGHKILISQNPFRRGLVSLSYLAPSSIARTLFLDGYGFAYSAYLKEQDLKNMITGSESLFDFVLKNRSLFLPLESLKGVDFTNQQRMLEALGGDYDRVVNILSANKNLITDPELLKVLSGIEKLNSQINNSLGLKWAGFLNDYIGELKSVLQRRLLAILGEKLSWGIKGLMISGSLGLRNLFRKAFRSFGFVTRGDLPTIIVYMTTEIMDRIREQFLKPMSKFLTLIGLILLSFMLILFASSFSIFDAINPFNPLRDVHIAQIVEPPAIVKCARGRTNLVAGIAESSLPKLENVQCPLISKSALICNRGVEKSLDFLILNSIGVTSSESLFWYAPSDGIITKSTSVYYNPHIPAQKCGGIVHLKSQEHGVTYFLMHVLPYVAENQKVKKGDIIAKMSLQGDGNINFSFDEKSCIKEPTIYLEVLNSDIYVDTYYREVLNCNLGLCPE